jgi:hypothetical protein
MFHEECLWLYISRPENFSLHIRSIEQMNFDYHSLFIRHMTLGNRFLQCECDQTSLISRKEIYI